MDEEKAVKYVKQFSIFYMVILIIGLIISKGQGWLGAIIGLVLLTLCYIGANDRKVYGPVCGIIASVLYIIAMDIISIIMGIFMIVNCANLIKYLK